MIHLFSEIDIDPNSPLNDKLIGHLFDQCEALGFSVRENGNTLIFSGPFNVPDNWETECVVEWNESHSQIREAYWEIRDTNFEIQSPQKHYFYHFLQGETDTGVEELQWA